MLIIADVKLPNINPIIKIDMVFLTLFAAKITADNTKNEPKLAAIAIAQLEKEIDKNTPPKIDDPKINNATPKLAPEEIPKTNGPANGFLNKVCINKPLIDNPDPTKTAVIALGILKSNTIVCQLSLIVSSPKIMAKISVKGIETDPKLIFVNQSTITNNSNRTNCFVYFF
jgi:hypothetical protein